MVESWANTAPAVAVVGDAVFAGSMRRFRDTGFGSGKGADGNSGSAGRHADLPGHGPLTTVGEERAHNPF